MGDGCLSCDNSCQSCQGPLATDCLSCNWTSKIVNGDCIDISTLANQINSTNITNLTNVNDLANIGASISSFYSTDSSSNSSCSNDNDCLNNGSCLNQSTCICQQGYWGSNCNFTQANSQQATQQNSQILDQLTNISLNSSNNTQKIAQVLVQMTSVTEINNDETVNKTFDLLTKLANSTDMNSSSLIISTVSNIIDIVSSSDNSSTSNNQMNKAIQVVNQVIDSQLSSNNTQPNTPILITTANIEIKAAKLNTTDEGGLNNTLNTILNSNDSSNTSTKVIVNDEFLNILGNVSGPAISVTKWNSNPHGNADTTSNITSSVVSFQVQDQNQNTVSIQNLSNPIQIQISKNSNNEDPSKKMVCKYFDQNTNIWETDGLILVSENNDSIVCNCTHLTDFSGSLDLIIPSTTLPNDDTDWYTTENNFGIYASVIYFCFFFMISLMLFCCKFSKYSSKIDKKLSNNIKGPDMTADPINKEPNSSELFAKREKLSINQDHPGEINKSLQIYNISPIYAVFHSRNNIECRRRISGFIIYLMLVSMFLACLYSSPDLDVLIS